MVRKQYDQRSFLASAMSGVLLMVALVCVVSTVSAELPPSAYKSRQEAAEEQLQIKVMKVQTRQTDQSRWIETEVEAKAQVTSVQRTKSRLRAGDQITIKYAHRRYKEFIAGPSEVPILREGETRPAFLNKGEQAKTYVPAAGGYTFTLVQ